MLEVKFNKTIQESKSTFVPCYHAFVHLLCLLFPILFKRTLTYVSPNVNWISWLCCQSIPTTWPLRVIKHLLKAELNSS